jgi:transposase
VLAEIYDGGRRTDAARIGNVGLQVIRDWVLRFNAEGADGLIDKKPPGARVFLTRRNAGHLSR